MRIATKLKSGTLFALLLALQVAPANASSLFDDDEVIDIDLIGPISTVIDDTKNREERPFILRAFGIDHAVQVRMRGKSRSRVCSFPPLRLRFEEGEAHQTVFDEQTKLKLVTHCRNSNSYQVDALQEYAAYKIFSLLSDVSYRVRLLRVNYVDSESTSKKKNVERYAFFIESDTELATRVGAQPVEATGVSLRTLDSRQAATVYVFQYLIGNTDWSMVMADEDDKCCHNGDLFDIGSALYYVPYDFDLSGLANPRYASPDPSLRISRVTQRLYRGYCISVDSLKEALGEVKAKENDILDVVGQLPGLSQKEVDSSNRYLDQFFDRAIDAEKLVKSFDRNCL